MGRCGHDSGPSSEVGLNIALGGVQAAWRWVPGSVGVIGGSFFDHWPYFRKLGVQVFSHMV